MRAQTVADLTASRMAAALRARELSARRALADAAGPHRRVNPALNAIVTLDIGSSEGRQAARAGSLDAGALQGRRAVRARSPRPACHAALLSRKSTATSPIPHRR